MNLPTEALLHAQLFNWMSESDFEMLANCFDMEVEQLSAGKSCESRGRLGYLLFGSGCVCHGDWKAPVVAGAVWGLENDPASDFSPAKETLTAWEDCQLIWLNYDIMTSVCYRACWFHGRFITEAKKCLEQQRRTRN